MRFFPFGCIWNRFAKLAAKRAILVQLMQKFCHKVVSEFFASRSTPLDPKLMFWCVSFRLGAFGTVLLLHETCCKTHQTSAINEKVRAMMSFSNFSQLTLPIHTIGTETHVLVRFFPFGCICDRFGTARNLPQNMPNWCN